MSEARHLATQLRYRQHQLSHLEPAERISRLTLELREMCKQMSSSERISVLEDLEQILPTGLTDSPALGSAASLLPQSSSPAPDSLSLDELLYLARKKLDALNSGELPLAQAKALDILGLQGRMPAAQAAVKGQSFEKLSEAIETVRSASLKDPDLLLNPRLKVFSKGDITNLQAFVSKLNNPGHELGQFLRKKLSLSTRELLARFSQRAGARGPAEEALEEDFGEILSTESIYEEQRFKGIQLSPEALRLLEQFPNLEGRALERFNQALLESAYPDELCFQTCEREFLDKTEEFLQARSGELSTERALGLAAVCLRELGCIEQFARMVLINFKKEVFDEVFGHIKLDRQNDLNCLLLDYLEHGDVEKLSSDVRNWAGLIKGLLKWYSFSAWILIKPLDSLNLKRFFDPENGGRRTVLGDIPFEVWNQYVPKFNQIREELFNAADKRDERQRLNEELLTELVNRIVERKVTTTVTVMYGWKSSEDTNV